jgi:rhodanese-related sulfurtransferase
MFGLRRTPSITPSEAAERLRTGTLRLVDVRTRHEFDQVRVPGAEHVPLHALTQRLDQVPVDRAVGFLCHSGHRSAVATRRAVRTHPHAVNVAGGMHAWLAAGLPHTSRRAGAA